MKIVVCFYFQKNSIPLGKGIADGFAALGHEVSCFDSSARERLLGGKRIAKSLAIESGAKAAVWWVQNPRWQDTFKDEARQFDFAYSIDESACNDFIRYLPSWAINRTEFHPLTFEEKQRKLLFIGAWSERREQHLVAVADLPLDIIGPDWNEKLPRASPLRDKLVTDRVSQSVMATHYPLGLGGHRHPADRIRGGSRA